MNNKILIATGIYPPDIGGPATMLEALVNSLRADGFAVKVLTYADQTGQKDDIYRVSRSHSRYLRYFLKMTYLAWWADIIYVTDVYSVGYFAYLLKRLIGKKYIIRFAGDSAWETAVVLGLTQDYIWDFQKKVYSYRIEKMKARRAKVLTTATKVIAVSQFMAKLSQKIGVKVDKVKTIYNAIDFGPAPSRAEDKVAAIKKQFGHDAKIVMTACRLTAWKGMDGLIKILPKLSQTAGKVNLLILGSGPELSNLQKLAQEKGVAEQVHWLGVVPNSEIDNYLRAADLFILNSNYEVLSHILLEAMRAGVPVVASTAGGNPEVITDGQEGLLVHYNNEEELLAASLKILQNRDVADNLVAAAKEKLKRFRWAQTVAQTEEVIKEVCHG